MSVNQVNGAQEVSASGAQGEQRIVEQKPEEMFGYGSEDDIGDGLELTNHPADSTTTETGNNTIEQPSDADKSEYYSGNYWSDFLKASIYSLKSYKNVYNKGFSNVMREQKENIDEYIDKHPVASWFDGFRLYRLPRKLF